MLASDDPVEERPLVVVGDPWVGGPAENVAGQLQHVVGGAVLLGVARQGPREFPRIGVPILAVAGATRGIGAARSDFPPEVARDLVVPGLSGQLVAPGGADDLGNSGVGVHTLQLVAFGGEGYEDPLVVEPVSQVGPLILPGDR